IYSGIFMRQRGAPRPNVVGGRPSYQGRTRIGAAAMSAKIIAKPDLFRFGFIRCYRLPHGRRRAGGRRAPPRGRGAAELRRRVPDEDPRAGRGGAARRGADHPEAAALTRAWRITPPPGDAGTPGSPARAPPPSRP